MDDQTADIRPPPDARASRPAAPRTIWKRVAGLAIGALAVIGLGGGGVLYWLDTRHFESTDDAFIDANTTQIAPRVAGQVTELLFDDNQHVAAGQVLLRIDPRDLQARLDQAQAQQASAQAQLEQAHAQVAVQQANLDQARANVAVTDADLLQARQDFDRFRGIDPRAVTRQQIDSATAGFHAAEAKLQANRQMVAGAQAQVHAAEAQVAAAEASVRQAASATEAARLQLSYCTITAPVSGIATHRTVDPGSYVNPGQAMFALVEDGRWVTANFKETQLEAMRPGQDVQIAVDAVRGIAFRGRLDSFQAGTGSAFSSLPAENATGNYVKILQRLPVKIVFDDDRVNDYVLAPGMSVVPSVRVR